MRATLIQAAIVACVALGVAPARAQKAGDGGVLDLSRGTVRLGGATTFTTTATSAFGSTSSGFAFSLAPSAGFFVANRFEIVASLQLYTPLGDLNYGRAGRLGAMAGARYHFGLAPRLSLYAGLEVGAGYNWVETPLIGTRTYSDLTVGVPAGLLVALNRHVALDVGLRITVTRAFDTGTTTLSFPIGFLGVHAFF